MKSFHLAAVLLALNVSVTRAAEDLVSGPPVGSKFSSVQCYANSGTYAGREAFNAAKEIGDRPGAFLFIHVLNRNTAPVIRGVNNLFTELQLFGFKGFIVMLSADRTAGEEQMKRVNGALRLRHPMVLSLDGLDGPGDLALNRRCTLSLVVAAEGKVTSSFGFTDTGLHDMDRMRKACEGAIGEIPTKTADLQAFALKTLPKDESALRRLAAQQAVDLYRANRAASIEHKNSRAYPQTRGNMRSTQPKKGRSMDRGARPSATKTLPRKKASNTKPESASKATRRGGPPSDSELNGLLRSYIRKDNPDEMVDEVYGKIEARAKESGALDKEAIAMFQLLLSYPDRYGSDHAQKLARKFLAARGEK
ncbi:MAG: hypothetical protein ACJASX_001526 [Limisphaerales bacterium]|jgi:hypothetical protein